MNYKDSQVNKDIILQSEFAKLLPYVLAQARHESANFSSPVYKANNNAFGMKNGSFLIEGESKGSKSPEGNTYARYTSDTISFKDLLRWLRWSKMPTAVKDVAEYAEALKARKYYGDSTINYTKALKRWM